MSNESITASLGPKRVASEFFALASAAKRSCIENISTPKQSSSSSSAMVKDEEETTTQPPKENEEESSSSIKLEAVKCHERLLTTLMTFDFSARRLPALAQRCAQDEAYYAKAQRSISEQISNAHSDLERLKAELETARQMQIQRALYERQAKSVLKKHAPRDQLKALLLSAERDYAAAAEEQKALDAKMELRVAQFLPVLSSVISLSNQLKEEEVVEARRKVLELALLEKDSAEDASDLPSGNRSRDDGGRGGGGGGGGGGGVGGGEKRERKHTVTADQEGGGEGGSVSEQGTEGVAEGGGGGSESTTKSAEVVINSVNVHTEQKVAEGVMEEGEQ